ncbi:unnamed protein product [Ilex paraguariensis]|uniref:non-specific serine/threonine protein kinase n=1 Tax=Ilex paraguariensis TaxID=185542 RepID=A0ABC8TVR1_9AQUA
MLEGNIPPSLGNCQHLTWLTLSQNNFSGNIPKQLFGIATLSVMLLLGQNRLSGSLPLEVDNLKNLVELDVSENELSGEIPSSLGSCTNLERLCLEGKFFQGSIPNSLQSLRGLQEFDLSSNNLSGPIPIYLEKFSLQYLNLSFNDLEGQVPMEGIFSNASEISVVGNHRLCGGISQLQLPKCTVEKPRKHKMSLAVILIISVACLLVAVTMVSCSILCWFRKKREHQISGLLLGPKSLFRVSYDRLHKATEGFSSENLIGLGSFASVYKGVFHEDDTVVAVKVLNLQHRGASKTFMAECEALRNVRHRNLVKIISSCSSIDFQGNDFKALVYEFMSNGSLERWLHPVAEAEDGENKFKGLNLLQRINFAIDVADALDYLHNHCQTPIIHCDLKPSNILLDREMVAHVGDFGLSKILKILPEPINSNQSSSIGIRGTVGYAPPEYGLGSEVSTNGDVYSYGILLLEMIIGRRPTEPMFEGGLNLHNFAKMALPDRVPEIVELIPLASDQEEVDVTTRSYQNPSQSMAEKRKEQCLISMIKIGVACSMEAPQDRMNIVNVVNELNAVKKIFQGTRTHL